MSLQSFPSIFIVIRKQDPENDSFITGLGFIYTMVILLSFLSGSGSAILWVGVGRYITRCANDDVKGLYFSLFWILFAMN